MRILITGSRQMLDQGRVYRALDDIYAGWGASGEVDPFVVVHGGAPGADTLAGQWCHDRRAELAAAPVQEVHPAEWNRYGKIAGGIRNAKMVGLGADLVLAFFQPGAGNVGTSNCVTQARLAGLTVEEMWE